MYVMISGTFPFEKPDLPDKICSEYCTFDGSRWLSVSIHAKDLIRQLLTKMPETRFTAKHSLDHFFFSKLKTSQQNILNSQLQNSVIFEQLSGYRGTSQLKKAALNLLARSTMERRDSDQEEGLSQKLKDLRV